MKFSKLITLATYLVASNLVAAQITLTAGPVSCDYKNKDTSETYDENSDVSINCNGTSCTVNGSGATASEGIVNISAAGTYIVQGSLEGQLRIEATKDDFIHLILDSATISSPSGPAIYGVNADKVTITLIGDSELTDTTNYTVVNEEPDACLFIDADLSINGSGSLSVTGNYSEAIRCKKDLKLVTGQITVPKAVKKGIKAKNSICIKEATIDVTSTDSGIKVTRDDNPDKGYVVIDGGDISVTTDNKGIHAETHLTIKGGYIDIKKCKEGLEGQMIDVLGGETHILATDDGINASKISTGTSNGGGWGRMGGGSDGSVYANIVGGKTFITVQGRDLDGIDANGNLYIGGNAEVYVSNQGGAIYGNMAAFDADGFNAICAGATVIGTAGGSSGGGGMRWKRQFGGRNQQGGGRQPGGQQPGGQFGGGMGGMFGETGSVYQPYIQTSITAQNAGTPLSIKDSNGKEIASFTPINAYSSILVTSPLMVAGQSYTIVAGSTTLEATATAGATGSVTPPSVTSIDEVVASATTKTTKKASPTQAASSCSKSILNQGYSCCSADCTVIYTDEDGDWGVENNEWCGCTPSSCPTSITSQGYPCCSLDNCKVYYVDEDGDWGVENNEWCGTPSSCSK